MPCSVFEIFASLGDLADVDLRIEVGGESLVMIAGIAVYDVEVNLKVLSLPVS